MAVLDTPKINYHDREVKVPKGSLLKRIKYGFTRRKQLVAHNREQRRQLLASLDNLTDPTFLQRVNGGK